MVYLEKTTQTAIHDSVLGSELTVRYDMHCGFSNLLRFGGAQ
jgi:hypothetical protein